MNRTDYMKEYGKKNRERLDSYAYERHKKMRDAAHAILGGACSVCGFSDSRALQIDHVDSDGSRESKSKGSSSYYKQVIESVMKGEKRYQLLCANHNWIKRCEQNETRGRGAALTVGYNK